jgi:AraC-like DNA-binding protein
MDAPFDADEFLNRVDWRQVARALTQLLVEDAFFMKDAAGRFVMQNRRACEHCRAAGESETLGRRDEDFWPGERATLYVEGDRMVMRSGRPLVHQLAPAPEEAGSDNLIAYSKFPVTDLAGRIIGVAGIHHLIDDRSSRATALGGIHRAVRRIHDDLASDLKVAELARVSGLSASQLTRRFKAVLGMSPKEYQLRVRVRTACRLLETTDWTVARVGAQSGFYDHSHFSRAFRRHTGLSPARYRTAHMAGGEG